MVRVVEAKGIATIQGGKDLPYCVIEFDKNEVVVNAKEVEKENITWQHRAHLYVYQVDCSLQILTTCTISDVSRDHELSVSIYQPKASATTVNGAKDSSKDNNDVLLGSVKLRPKFVDGGLQDGWYPVQNFSVDGKEVDNSGEIHLQIGFKKMGVRFVAFASLYCLPLLLPRPG